MSLDKNNIHLHDILRDRYGGIQREEVDENVESWSDHENQYELQSANVAKLPQGSEAELLPFQHGHRRVDQGHGPFVLQD